MRVTDDDLKDVIKLHLCKLHHMKQCQVWLLGLAIKVAPVLGSRQIQFYCSVYIISGVGFQETQFIFVLPAELTLELHKVFEVFVWNTELFLLQVSVISADVTHHIKLVRGPHLALAPHVVHMWFRKCSTEM